MLNEFDPKDESTWKHYPMPHRPSWFQEGLDKIAGINRFGGPNLKLVWGGDEMNDRTAVPQLKYLCGYSPQKVHGYRYEKDGVVHFTENIDDLDSSILVLPEIKEVPLGLPRWVVERYVSPETLEAQGRFRNRYADGDLEPTLREFPRKGIYDTYFIIENAEGKFRQVDRDVLDHIKMMYWYDQKPFEEREADRERILAEQEASREKALDEISEAAVNFDLKLPQEEKERREEYWRTKVNHHLQERIAQATGKWYVPDNYAD